MWRTDPDDCCKTSPSLAAAGATVAFVGIVDIATRRANNTGSRRAGVEKPKREARAMPCSGCRAMRTHMCWVLLLLALARAPATSYAEVLEPIYWSASNKIFQPGRGGLVVHPQIGDKLDIVCPRIGDGGPPGGGGTGFGSPSSSGAATETYQYKLYMVTQSEAESCDTTRRKNPLLTCNRPDRDVKYTIKFQEFSPSVLGLEFQRGRDYYIISTSTGTEQGIMNGVGGVCQSNGMKLIMKVGQDPNRKEETSPVNPSPSPTRARAAPPRAPGDDRRSNDRTTRTDPSDSLHELHQSGMESNLALIVGVSSGSLILLLLLLLLALSVCYVRRSRESRRWGRGGGGGGGSGGPGPGGPGRRGPHLNASAAASAPPPQSSLPLSLTPGSVAVKLGGGGGGGNNNGSDPSDVVIPLRTLEGGFCPHYEKVSGDYGHPVYIVQEVPPPSNANVYYKV
ncbi:LOW QUALITY PROTEIN: ephrin-B2a-like [Lampetra planeri]